ncbi:hypothetical protein F2Q69_00038082 [Brassica cretica]|uniref:Uncharacterized protein n=1 Tax=Brassica cretica TaxID=69181 RepID=A0A8S9SEZ5_BRACR|nr:hypothetical protein F2Q69_00038082 [Brassica cretica]
MFRLHFAYMSPYQILEYHMEFLETFGCIWSSKESDLARTTPRCRSRLHRSEARERPYSDVPERHHKVAPAGSDVTGVTQRGASSTKDKVQSKRRKLDDHSAQSSTYVPGEDDLGSRPVGVKAAKAKDKRWDIRSNLDCGLMLLVLSWTVNL